MAAGLVLVAWWSAPRPLAASVAAASTATELADEYSVKSAFLYNFARSVSWPIDERAEPKAAMIVAVLGKNPFGKQLEVALKGRHVGERELDVVYFKSVGELKPCQILFVPESEQENLATIRKALGDQAVLIIGESVRAARAGAHIGFYIEKSHVRFAINKSDLRKDGLEASSELLKLARIVIPARETCE